MIAKVKKKKSLRLMLLLKSITQITALGDVTDNNVKKKIFATIDKLHDIANVILEYVTL